MPVPAKRDAGRRKGRWVSSGKSSSEVLVWNRELKGDVCVAFTVAGNEGGGCAAAGMLPKGRAAGRLLSKANGAIMTNTVLRHTDDTLVAHVQAASPCRVSWYSCCDLSDSSFITSQELSPSDFPLTAGFHVQGKGLTLEITDVTRQVLNPKTRKPAWDNIEADLSCTLDASFRVVREEPRSVVEEDLAVKVKALEADKRNLQKKFADFMLMAQGKIDALCEHNKMKETNTNLQDNDIPQQTQESEKERRIIGLTEHNKILERQIITLREANTNQAQDVSSRESESERRIIALSEHNKTLERQIISMKEANDEIEVVTNPQENVTLQQTQNVLARERERKIEALKQIARQDHEMQDLRGKLGVVGNRVANLEVEVIRAVRRAEEVEKNTAGDKEVFDAKLEAQQNIIDKLMVAEEEASRSHEKIERGLKDSLQRSKNVICTLNEKVKSKSDELNVESEVMEENQRLRVVAGRCRLLEARVVELEEERRAWVEEEESEEVLVRENSFLREENANLELELCRFHSMAAGAEAALAVQTAEHTIRMAEMVTELADTASHCTSEASLITASPHHYDSDTSSDQSVYPHSPKIRPKFITYEMLRMPSYLSEPEIDVAHREQYLAPLEFQAVFQMTKDEFNALRQTEKDARKRAVSLL